MFGEFFQQSASSFIGVGAFSKFINKGQSTLQSNMERQTENIKKTAEAQKRIDKISDKIDFINNNLSKKLQETSFSELKTFKTKSLDEVVSELNELNLLSEINKDNKDVLSVVSEKENILKMIAELKVLQENQSETNKILLDSKKESFKISTDKEIAPEGLFKRMKQPITEFAKKHGLALKVGSAFVGAFIAGIERQMEAVGNMSSELGILSDRMLPVYKDLSSEAQEIYKSGSKIYETSLSHLTVQLGLKKEFGAINAYSIETLDNISNLKNVIGVSAQEATTFLGVLRGINSESAEANYEFLRMTSILASNHMVSFKDVMSDIQGSAEFFATYMNSSSDDIGRMAIQLRKVGTEMGTIVSIMNSFDNVQNIIQRQAQASMFIGQNFDLIGVAQRQMTEGVESATTYLLEQLAMLNKEFLNNPLAKKQFAQNLGVSVVELNKLIEASEKINDPEMKAIEEFRESTEEFNKTFSQLGFSRLKREFEQNFLMPIQRLLIENSAMVEAIISGASSMIGAGRWLVEKLISVASLFTKITGSSGTALGGVLIAGVGASIIAGATQFGQMILSNPLDIDRNMTLKQILIALGGHSVGLAKNMAKSTLNASKVLIPVGMATAGASQTGSASGAIAPTIGSLGGMWLGAKYGAKMGLLGGPKGALVGAVAGAIGGGLTGMVVNHYTHDKPQGFAKGAIFTRPYEGRVQIAEKGQKEALIPLDSKRGQDMLAVKLDKQSLHELKNSFVEQDTNRYPDKINLSDECIRKLAKELREAPINLSMNINNKNNRSRNFISEAMNPSSTLTIDI